MQVVEQRVVFRACRDRGAAEYRRPPRRLSALSNILDAPALNVHPADEDHLRPGQVLRRRLDEVLVDESDRPRFRKDGGHHQQPLRRHERLRADERVGILERAERRLVLREDHENAAGRQAPAGGFTLMSVRVAHRRSTQLRARRGAHDSQNASDRHFRRGLRSSSDSVPLSLMPMTRKGSLGAGSWDMLRNDDRRSFPDHFSGRRDAT
jgi:hypothetical protein